MHREEYIRLGSLKEDKIGSIGRFWAHGRSHLFWFAT